MRKEMKVTGRMCRTKPDYSTAWTLAEEIRAFYEDPENVRKYEEWLKKREAQQKGA